MSSKNPSIKSASEPLDIMFHCLEKIILTLFSGNASGWGLAGRGSAPQSYLVSDASSPLPTPLLILLFPLLWSLAKNHCLPFLSLYSLSPPLPFTIKLLEKHSHRSPPGTPHQLKHSFQSPVLPTVLAKSWMASLSLKQWPGSPHPTWTSLSALPLERSFCEFSFCRLLLSPPHHFPFLFPSL